MRLPFNSGPLINAYTMLPNLITSELPIEDVVLARAVSQIGERTAIVLGDCVSHGEARNGLDASGPQWRFRSIPTLS